MEVASVGAGGENHLKNVLSDAELNNIPDPVANKINGYIEQKFEEYLTSKALHETSKSQIGKTPGVNPCSACSVGTIILCTTNSSTRSITDSFY